MMADQNLLPDTQEQTAAAAQDAPQFQFPPLDISWAKVPTERPPRPHFGEEGFTLKMADVGSYGWAPDRWPYQNDTPRGSWPSDDMGLPAPYTIYEKSEVWADNCADLYEAAIRDRWSAATQISWGAIEPLPEHVELALDQIFTHLSEQAYNANQTLMGWFKEISYGYHEVKLFLSTQTFDLARHTEAFRKRALVNGGALGIESPGFLNRAIAGAFKFTEYVVYANVLRTSFNLALMERSDILARSQADRQLMEMTARDLRRHLAYGIEHLKYYLQTDLSRRPQVNNWLNRGEVMMAADLRRDTPLREALILALGDSVAEGKVRLKELRRAQLEKYLLTLEAATVRDRRDALVPAFREVMENP